MYVCPLWNYPIRPIVPHQVQGCIAYGYKYFTFVCYRPHYKSLCHYLCTLQAFYRFSRFTGRSGTPAITPVVAVVHVAIGLPPSPTDISPHRFDPVPLVAVSVGLRPTASPLYPHQQRARLSHDLRRLLYFPLQYYRLIQSYPWYSIVSPISNIACVFSVVCRLVTLQRY